MCSPALGGCEIREIKRLRNIGSLGFEFPNDKDLGVYDRVVCQLYDRASSPCPGMKDEWNWIVLLTGPSVLWRGTLNGKDSIKMHEVARQTSPF